jgi:hypothetical protein
MWDGIGYKCVNICSFVEVTQQWGTKHLTGILLKACNTFELCMVNLLEPTVLKQFWCQNSIKQNFVYISKHLTVYLTPR